MYRLLLALLLAFLSTASARTNFVFFLVDDMGFMDIGANGSTFHETPNIDALAASGMRFTNGYAACPVCSPTRGSIMTGRHPVRIDITDWIPGSTGNWANRKFKHVDDLSELPHKEVTMAEALKEHGYRTFFAGKWHLGGKGFWPEDQGFDINIGGHHKGSPPGGYYAPWQYPNLEPNKPEEYITERLTEESIAFLEGQGKDDPFLLYLAYYNIHTPIQPYKKRIEHYRKKLADLGAGPEPGVEHHGLSRMRQDNAELASMVAAVDDSVGAILGALDDLKLAQETVVIFFSDNGGLSTLTRPGPGCNLPLRSGKGWLYEGGVREPCIVRAPGVTKAGAVSDVPVVSMDFFPTMLALAGLPQKPELHADGVSLKPLLAGEKELGEIKDRALYWHYPHYHGSTWTPGGSIRAGEWKLIEFWEFDEVELYHLDNDPGEQKNLAAERPEVVQELRRKLGDWRKKLGARMPEPHEDHDPEGAVGPAAGKRKKR